MGDPPAYMYSDLVFYTDKFSGGTDPGGRRLVFLRRIADLSESSLILYKKGENVKEEKELEYAMREAHSLVPGTFESPGLELIGVQKTKEDSYYFYKEKATGEYYYTSEMVERFDKKMKERERQRRRCYRRSKI